MKKDTRSNVNHSLIDDLLIKAKTKESFKLALNAGTVKSTSIALIEDTDELWTHGKYHRFANNSEVVDYSKRYLRTTALDSGTISFNIHENVGTDMITSISYSKDNGETWFTLPNEDDKEENLVLTVNVSEGDEVLWKGIAESVSIYDNDGYKYSFFSSTARFNADGNIMSLLYGDNFIGQTTLKYTCQFAYLFSDSDSEFSTLLISAENLSLPATTLTESCYMDMFDSCELLTTAPKILPATTLAEDCYDCMFYGCTSLTTPPELPATTLADWCYCCMFEDCTALSVSPKLPATILAYGCYDYMFDGSNALPDCTNIDFTSEKIVASGGLIDLFAGTKVTDEDLMNILPINPDTGNYWLPVMTLSDKCYDGMFILCTSLITAPELPATTLAHRCYYEMFSGCTSLTTAPELPATTLAHRCYYEMFSGCTSLTTAPELPATILVAQCYEYMFSGCSLLNYIKCLGINGISGNTDDWVRNVAETGTFVKSRDAVFSVGGNGIPVGWNIVEEGEESSYTPSGYALQYLKTTALENGKINFYIPASIGTDKVTSISYSTDNGATWIDTNNINNPVEIVVNVTANQEVLWKGIAERLSNEHSTYSDYASKFTGTARFNVEGNIMSLCYGDNFINEHKINYSDLFSGLFAGSKVVNASNLSLPADKLHLNCYAYMFYGCTSLVNAPSILPATVLATCCYCEMFEDCTSLTTAPELPATTLAKECYHQMFLGCTSLTTAPELPATELVQSCYYGMFSGCTSLITPPELPATTLINNCYQSMFSGCTSLTTAPDLIAIFTYENYGLYDTMFNNCTSLNYIKCLLTFDDDHSTLFTWGWVRNVAPTGIFVKADNMDNWTIGDSGIPTGWVVYTETEWRLYQLTQKLNQTELRLYQLTQKLNQSEFTIAAALNELDRKIDNFEQQTVTSVNGDIGDVIVPGFDGVIKITDWDDNYSIGDILWSDMKVTSTVRPTTDNVIPIGIIISDNSYNEFDFKDYWRVIGLKYMTSNGPSTSMSYMSWGPINNSVPNTADNDGLNNTIAISDTGNLSLYPAAYQCLQYSTIGTNAGDWYLGSKYELDEFLHNCEEIVNDQLAALQTNYSSYCMASLPTTPRDCGYWTSNEVDQNYADTAPYVDEDTGDSCLLKNNTNRCCVIPMMRLYPELEINNIPDGIYKLQYIEVTNSGNDKVETLKQSAILIQWTNYFVHQNLYSRSREASTRIKFNNTTWSKWSLGGDGFNLVIKITDQPINEGKFYEYIYNNIPKKLYGIWSHTGLIMEFEATSEDSFDVRMFTNDFDLPGYDFEISTILSIQTNTYTGDPTVVVGEVINNAFSHHHSLYHSLTTFTTIDPEIYDEICRKFRELFEDINPEVLHIMIDSIVNEYDFKDYIENHNIPISVNEQQTIVTSVNGMTGAVLLTAEDIKATSDYSKQYLTFEALENTTFTFSNNALQYSLDNGTTWTSLAAGTNTPTINAGSKIMWKQTGLTPNSSNGIGTFSSTGNFNISGNIMSLHYGDNFVGQTDLTGKDYAFTNLFKTCSKLINAENLILPATILALHCYSSMFKGCPSLMTTPKLPATTLAENCYRQMFNGCASLTTVPEILPATTLAEHCYQQMFFGCVLLTKAPELPATTLTSNCYYQMFGSCDSLTTAPTLPATTLVDSCYRYMFNGCTNLNYIKCLATNISANLCTDEWVTNVAASGTFIKANNMNNWTIGNSGIPLNWISHTESGYEVVRQYLLGLLPSQNELTIAAALNDLNTRIINLSKELAITNTYLAVNNYYSTLYLRTTALESGTIGFDIPANSLIVSISSISYSTDKGNTWTTTNYNGTAVQISINVNAGDEILWKGDASDFGGDPVGAHFTSTAKFNVDGNIMSLLYGDDFYNKYVLYLNNVFSALFYLSKVVNAKNLSLPAVQLSNNCYEYMFGFCSDLLTPPKLSAIKLSEGCYLSMFLNCSSLTTIPELPATELAPHCYESMFSGCTTLNNLQSYELPATELRSCCYKEMFKDCTHLTRINAFLLPATTLAKECYSDMFNGCSYLSAVPNLPATTLAVGCYARMFKHTETHSMELPAVLLVPGCYSGMFEDSGSVNNIKAMFITTPSDTYTKDWLKNVSNYGTFTKNENATWDVAGDNGIPTTWNVLTE